MRIITITPKKAFRISVEAENISPDKFASLNIEQIKSLTVWQGNRKIMLSKLSLSLQPGDVVRRPNLVVNRDLIVWADHAQTPTIFSKHLQLRRAL